MRMYEMIEQRLADSFAPAHLEVVNESGNHNVPAGSETHFKVVLVSPAFEGQRLIARHRAVNAVLAEARRQGALTAAITNFPDSNLGRQCEHVITLHAGEERSIAATKTYTASLAAIAALSTELAGEEQMRADLLSIPAKVEAELALSPQIGELTERYRYMRDCVVLGRGYNYATAFEFALKLKELTYTIAEPYSSADFMHGPLALIEHGFPALVVAPSGVLLPEMQQFMRTLQERAAEIVAISDDADTLAMGRTRIALPSGVPEWLSPITAIVPGQLFAMHLAAVRDYDPDHPRGLRKVTETH